MKRNIYLSLQLFIFFSLFFSCQKVIQLDLNTSTSQIVIQGNVYDRLGPDTVRLSKSVNFDQPNSYPAVTGAIVIISDDAGNSDTLTESKSGTYVTSTIQGISGHTYTLTVKTEGQTYTAISTMPVPVEINSVYFKKSAFGNEKVVVVTFQDSAIVKNYYRLVEFVNGVKQDQVSVTSDKLYDGAMITYQFRGATTDTKLVSGDVISVWLETVDKDVYEYFRTSGSGRGGQAASPANPLSNISNSALGYFCACSVRMSTTKIP